MKILINISLLGMILFTGCTDKSNETDSASCAACPTITSVSPSIGFAGDSIRITGTFKNVKAVYFGNQSVTPFHVSDGLITLEAPTPIASEETARVKVSVEVEDPNKPTATLHSNIKGEFKYAEIVTEEFAGKFGERDTAVATKLVNVDRKVALLFNPYRIVIDNEGNLYIINLHKLDKLDIKTGKLNTLLTFPSAFCVDVAITPNNELYLNLLMWQMPIGSQRNVITKYVPSTNSHSQVFSSESSISHMNYFNNELFYVSTQIVSQNPDQVKYFLRKVGSNSNLISFPPEENILAVKFIDNKTVLVVDEKNIYQFTDFKNPQPLLETDFIIPPSSGIKLSIDAQKRIHYLDDNQWIIKYLNKSNKKTIYKILLVKNGRQIVPDNANNFYVAEPSNCRILKVSLK